MYAYIIHIALIFLKYEYNGLSSFQPNVVSLFETEEKVLIVLYDCEHKLEHITSKLTRVTFIVLTSKNKLKEEEACEWLRGKSGKEFLIADNWTVADMNLTQSSL